MVSIRCIALSAVVAEVAEVAEVAAFSASERREKPSNPLLQWPAARGLSAGESPAGEVKPLKRMEPHRGSSVDSLTMRSDGPVP
jgi:hypothetical protein